MDDSFQEQQIKLARKYLKCKIMQDNLSFRDHNLEKQHLYDLIKRTIINGEAHSAFIIGPAGCGKTTLINAVLHELSKEIDLEENAVIVKLNGLLHHDDKVALKSITTQMQLENAVGDRVFGSFAANLSFLLSCIKTGIDRKCKSMVFILDEFDMFCHAGLGQTLLYNLFDITHNKTAPICVIGITRSINVSELLEKRVKSRFSNRNIFLYPSASKEPIENTIELFKQLLSLPKRKKSKKSDFAIPDDVFFNFHVDLNEFKALDKEFVMLWNQHIVELLKDDKVMEAIEKLCYYTNNEQIFRNILYQIISKLSVQKPYIDVASLITTIDKTVDIEDTVSLLQSLSILELSLVIAIKHGMDIFDGQPMNFEMVYHRYTKFANTNSSSQTVPRPVILKAFEHLQSLKIITPIRSDDGQNSTSSKVQKEYQLYTLCLPLDDIDRAVKGFKALPTEISHWYSSLVI